MTTKQMHNLPPNENQLLAINDLIKQQQSIIKKTRTMKEKNERIHQCLEDEAVALVRTLSSTKRLQHISLQMPSQTTEWIKQATEIFAQTIDEGVSSLLPTTNAFIESWREVEKSAFAFSSALQKYLPTIDDHVRSIAEQLCDTRTRRDETAHAITTLSTIIEASHNEISAKKQGILHPLRRLPVEILLQIFEECVEDEKIRLRQLLPTTPGLPRIVLVLASVSRRWRLIITQAPRLWSCIRIPAGTSAGPFRYRHAAYYTGRDHFNNFLSNSQWSALELTVPRQNMPVDCRTMNVNRLNLADVGDPRVLLSDMPSPLYLWMGYTSMESVSRTIPSRLLSRTTHITCFNVIPEFEGPVKLVTSLCLEGTQPVGLAVTRLLANLPRLQRLDLLSLFLSTQSTSTQQSYYSHISSLAIKLSALSVLEQFLTKGLCLASVRELVLSDLPGPYPLNFPTLSTQLRGTVTQLEFRDARSPHCIRAWIDSFDVLHTVVTWGDDIDDVLRALCPKDLGWEVGWIPGHCALYNKTHRRDSENRSIPKGLRKLVIREYTQDGTKICQQLCDIRANSDPETGPIDIFFDDCINISPLVRPRLQDEPVKKSIKKPVKKPVKKLENEHFL